MNENTKIGQRKRRIVDEVPFDFILLFCFYCIVIYKIIEKLIYNA